MLEGFIEARVDPVRIFNIFPSLNFVLTQQGPSQQALLILHAKIQALQSKLGISYKDAAHRLFMTEVERVKQADSGVKTFGIRTSKSQDRKRLRLQSSLRSITIPEIRGPAKDRS